MVVWTEGDAYEFFGFDVVARDELFATQVWGRKVVDCADWVFGGLLGDRKELLITSHGKSSNAL